jgi:ribose transport system substrate-binding protein
MHSRKLLIPFVAVGAVSVLLAGCSSAGGAGATDGEITLGYSQPHTDPFQNAEQKGVIERYAEEGYAYLPATNADRDAAQQIADIQTLINQGAKGLIISVGDSAAIVPAIEYANEYDVPIVAIDEAPASGKIAMIVRADNVALGELACQEMGKGVEAGSTVLTLDGDQVTSNGRDRTSGFNDCMDKNFPDVKLVHVATEWDPAKAANGIETQFNQNPDIAGVYVQSDATFYPSLLDTMDQIGKLTKVGEPGHVTLVSVDASPMAMTAIRDGFQDAAISQPLTDYITYGVEYLVGAIEGETFEAGPTDHNSTIGEYNGNLVDLLDTPVVTPANVEDDALWGNQDFAIEAFAAEK